MGDLTPRQARFAKAYAATGNGSEAARQAGYSPDSAKVTASRLLTKHNVAQAVDSEIQALAAAQGDTPDGIVAELHDLGTRAAEAGQYGPAVKATELRGRHLGMWEAKAPTGTGNVIVNIFDSSATVETDGESVRVSGNDERVIEGETV